MARAVAKALALVNWRGVFYERYWLDPNVTALEGPNGAGKTTVMVAAYLVLLPDLQRLRFTNVGESGASAGDKGIWGRLGDPARPSYAALAVDLPSGERVLIGVHIERKREPTLALTPFMIRGVAALSSLADVLLRRQGDTEEVPTLAEFRALAAASEVHLKVYRSSKDYFADLFELGISALRLNTEEERGKLNDMLRTSMTGGISRALTTELRGFMLKEDTGMGDTLSRMRENLRSCHRTRTEVSEARSLEQEITGVYDAGHTMFTAGILATKRALAEAEKEHAALRELELEASGRHRAIGEQRERLVELSESFRERLDQVHAERGEASALLEKAQTVKEVGVRLETILGELAEATEHERLASEAFGRLDAQRDSARAQVLAARQDAASAARGLADMQVGLDELHRKAHAYRQAVAQLEELREALNDPALEADHLDQVVSAQLAKLAALDQELARRAREQARAGSARSEYEAARLALRRLTDEGGTEDLHASARRALTYCRAQAACAEQKPALVQELAALQDRLELRSQLVDSLKGDVPDGALQSAAALRKALLLAEERLQAADASVLAVERRLRDAENERTVAEGKVDRLEERAARWARVKELCAELAEAGAPSKQPSDLAEWLRDAEVRERSLERDLAALGQRRELCLKSAAALHAPIGAFEAELLRIRDEVGGELLSERYQGVSPELASLLQARLGPLAQAIVVEDPQVAARRVQGKGRELGEVWFLKAGAPVLAQVLDDATQSHVEQGDLLVLEGQVARLSKLPEHPTLGREAREQEGERLLELAQELTRQLEERERERSALEQTVRRARRLLESQRIWEEGDPGELLLAEQTVLARELGGMRQEQEEARAAQVACRQRVARLAAAQRRSHLLDEANTSERCESVRARLDEAQRASEWLASRGEARELLESTLDVLVSLPPTEDELARWAEEARGLNEQRDQLFRLNKLASELGAKQAALSWGHALVALDERQGVVPVLVEQHEKSEERLAALEARLAELEASRDEHSGLRDAARARLASVLGQKQELERQRAAASLTASPEAVAFQATSILERSRALLDSLEQEARERLASEAVLVERANQVERELSLLKERQEAARASMVPVARAWAQLREDHGVLAEAALASRSAEILGDLKTTQLRALCRSKASLLADRLAATLSGVDVAAELQALSSREVDGLELPFPDLWLCARDWLLRRLPAQFADAADPLQALERLSGDLSQLERRLQRQEELLRGSSADVGRSIDVQLRRATAQVRRINEYLDGISFGGISAIRVRIGRDATMENVLGALRDGSAQELLFQSTLPIEDALEEIFRRYGGGRKGGARVLDYREYLELQVLVQRRGAEPWEPANPSRVSTGEAIGVGAALMMVILREWERDSTLMRDEPSLGAMRFLFLDEANRLSPDNLRVLFELCQVLELQLLIAAPEVAHAQGNTTYRLVRRDGLDGTEEVVVSGRRSELPELSPPASVSSEQSEPVQLTLGQRPEDAETNGDGAGAAGLD